MAEGREEVLASRLLDGVAALRRGAVAAAVDALEEVGWDPGLASADDLADVRARALTLLSDALVSTGRLAEAERAYREADRLIQAAGDVEGTRALKPVWTRLQEARRAVARDATARTIAETLQRTTLDELRTRFSDAPERLTAALVKKANAEVDAGNPARAMVAAQEALQRAVEAGDLRHEVLAQLSLARANPECAEKHLLAAWRSADKADAFTLVGAVARAATAHDVTLPAQVGPELTRRFRSDHDPEHGMG